MADRATASTSRPKLSLTSLLRPVWVSISSRRLVRALVEDYAIVYVLFCETPSWTGADDIYRASALAFSAKNMEVTSSL